MTNIIEENLELLEFLEIQQYNNMTVIGITTKNTTPPDLMPLDIGLEMGLVEITEVDEDGIVEKLKVTNNAVTPLLIMDGEEIEGAKQNRIVNATIIIAPKSQETIDVSCTESGRWNYTSKTFKHSNHIASSRVRRGKQYSVHNSLRNSNEKKSNQSEVWSNIELTQDLLEVKSDTHAQQDTYINSQTKIDEYLKHFHLQENQNAAIIIINNQIVGMEVLYDKQRYSQYHQRYMESYIIDAIAQKEEYHNRKSNVEELSEEFMERIKSSKIEKYEEDSTVDYRLEDDKITGSLIFYEDNLINASILRKLESTN